MYVSSSQRLSSPYAGFPIDFGHHSNDLDVSVTLDIFG
jgi:hypothetical protein